jgi:hypothetical protein
MRSELRRLLVRLFGLDLRSLGLFRILLALVLLIDLARRATDLRAHYTDEGVLPRDAAIQYALRPAQVSLHLMNGSLGGQAILFALAIAFGLALLVGYRTRLACFGSWALLASLHNRNPLVLYGADDLLRMLLLWGLFVPLGGAFGIDAARDPPRGAAVVVRAGAALGEGAGEEAGAGTRHLSLGGAALLLQVAMVYWVTAALKSSPEWREDGTAIFYALQNEQFADRAGVWLTHYPSLLRGMTPAVWTLEAFGPFLLFSPLKDVRLRLAGMLAFALLHAGLFLFMALGIFPFVSVVALVPFLPPEVWPRLEGPVSRARAATAAALAAVAKPGAEAPGRDPDVLRRDAERRCRSAANAAAALLLIDVVCLNLGSIPGLGFLARRPLASFADALALQQSWDMFAPRPMVEDGWYVIPGRLENGKAVDVYKRAESPVSWQRPPLIIDTYRNDRWQCYLWALSDKDFEPYLLFYGKYLCRSWNRDRREGSRLKDFEIYLMSMPVVRGSSERPVTRELLWKHSCF